MAYRVDINQIYTDLLALFRNNLTTLNQNLTTQFTNANLQIVDAFPSTVGDSIYPIIFLHQGSKNENIQGISNICRRGVFQNILITAFTKAFRQGANIDNSDNRNLMANIDELIRNNPQFSSQILDCNPVLTQPLYDESSNIVYMTAFETTLECQLDVRGI